MSGSSGLTSVTPEFRSGVILQVALPVPLRKTFDYLPPQDGEDSGLQAGVRVRVPFGNKRVVGMLMAVTDTSAVQAAALRRVEQVLDHEPLLPSAHLALLDWASRYYQYPIGEVVLGSLPHMLAKGLAQPGRTDDRIYRVCAMPVEPLTRAPRQAALLTWLAQQDGGASAVAVSENFSDWQRPLAELLRKQYVEVLTGELADQTSPEWRSDRTQEDLELTVAQQQAVAAIGASAADFRVFLLAGVTGSGKTEVYLRSVAAVLAGGRQVLVLVPEIGLTEQTISRFRKRFPVPIAVLHSGLASGMRAQDWALARSGQAAIVIGTRSAVWTPLPKLGLIVIDEEHDLSYKQQDGFRYSARDVGILRAQRCGIPIVLGSATPSLESLHNARGGRFQQLLLPERAGPARLPNLQLVDLRNAKTDGGLSETVLAAIADTLQQQEQVLLFLNRRGYAPLLLCHSCGWSAECDSCDAKLVYHRGRALLCCHHCGRERRMNGQCQVCGGRDLRAVGQGTERLEQVVSDHFPLARVARVDRDSMRRRGLLQQVLGSINSGELDIIIGTQMLTKGHHFPTLTLVVVVDGDAGFYSNDFRASERMAQQLIQVIGRAGRGSKAGTVLLQTHCPQHPTLQSLLRLEYVEFAETLLAERHNAGLPPYASMALLRAEAHDVATARAFLDAAKACIPPAANAGGGQSGITLFGPVPAFLERRANRYRWQLLIQAGARSILQNTLAEWIPSIENLPMIRKIRWSLDVDPLDLT